MWYLLRFLCNFFFFFFHVSLPFYLFCVLFAFVFSHVARNLIYTHCFCNLLFVLFSFALAFPPCLSASGRRDVTRSELFTFDFCFSFSFFPPSLLSLCVSRLFVLCPVLFPWYGIELLGTPCLPIRLFVFCSPIPYIFYSLLTPRSNTKKQKRNNTF